MSSDIRIGISGWRYGPWRGEFYPKGLVQRRELEYASRQLSSIEINGTFYSLQRPEVFQRWADEVPDDFLFAVKAPRYITHTLRLRDAEAALGNFLGSGLLRLGRKLGPLLWQFPPTFRYDHDRFARFCEQLPRDTRRAATFAKRHANDRIEDRSWFRAVTDAPLRHAIEIRHDSFCCEAFLQLLRDHNIALVIADADAKWPQIEEVTADFLYLRLHGADELYASGYDEAAIRRWARAISAWARGTQPGDARRISSHRLRRQQRDVFCYFDNDRKVRAPADARRLMKMLTLDWSDRHAA